MRNEKNPIVLPLVLLLLIIFVAGGFGLTWVVKQALKKPTPRAEVEKVIQMQRTPQAISIALAKLVYASTMSRAELIEGLKAALDHADPYVKLTAAEYLYTMGDPSARPALVQLMETGGPPPASEAGRPLPVSPDFRVEAASLIGKYRDRQAAEAIASLYRRTNLEALLPALVLTGANGALEILKSRSGGRPSEQLMILYGRLKAAGEAGFITKVFADPKGDVSQRLAAAWALVRTGQDADGAAARFIRDHVKEEYPRRTYSATGHQAVRYLGTFKDDESVKLLEKVARECTQIPLMKTAVVNLVLHHQDRSTAGQAKVISELSAAGSLGRDLAIQLAAASDDPAVIQAGEKFDMRRSAAEKPWKRQREHRKDWPVWSWAHEHILFAPGES